MQVVYQQSRRGRATRQSSALRRAAGDGMIVVMQKDFTRVAGGCRAWTAELPGWASLKPAGVVETYWRWREPEAPASTRSNEAAWGFRIGLGGRGLYGLLGATFEPHEYPYLRVAVAATTMDGALCPAPFAAARVGLPHEYVGGVLAGAAQEADRVGPGTVTFKWAAVHTVDSSWEVFRILAVGVMRLLAHGPSEDIPPDLLPYFGGTAPEPPGLV